MNFIMKKNVFTKDVLTFFLCFLCLSCRDNDEAGSTAYNPDLPVVFDSFTPEVGGMATRMILSGSNLGNDPKAVKVYFNNKRASVVGCDNGKALVITPRQPGENCTISVVVGKDSVVSAKKFTYVTRTIVSTVVGKKGTTKFVPGTFSEAEFRDVSYLAVDDEYNLFVSHQNSPNCIILVSQQNSTVTQLVADTKPNAPSTDITGKIIVVPLDPSDGYYEFDPLSQWAPRKRLILHPSLEEQAAGKVDFKINGYKHSFAICMLDSMIYTRSNRDGNLVKFDPKTRVGQMVGNVAPFNTDSYLVFDPVNKTKMYCCATGQNCIFVYDVLTKQSSVYAGKMGQAGWKDGRREDAQFNQPRQMILDADNNLVIADVNNHCIRKISPEGVVTTVVGIAGKAGYQDGSPEDALFNSPWGLAIDKDYTVYVADRGNQCIRKLTIE
jgi:hypothetical protein